MENELIQKYAEFAVKIGTNPQKGQTLIINAPVHCAFFARACAEAAYKLTEVREVVVLYNDEQLSRLKLEHTDIAVLEDVKPWTIRNRLDYLESKGGACFLHIIADDPEIYKGLDMEKIDRATTATRKASLPIRDYTMTDKVQWSIVAIPSEAWAQKVFPHDADAVEKLWQAIFDVCRVTGGDPIGAWEKHIAKMTACRDKLNTLQLDSVRLQSANGTDLTIGLAEDAVWEGAQSLTPEGYKFIANIPTEEVFTAPHREGTNGVVYGTKPYVYQGNLITDFCVTFKDGKVTDYDAKENKALLGKLLDTDEGARHIGEIALVPASSPINQKNILFYDTLFDENAACHIAFGDGYPGTVKGGTVMSKEQLLAKGVNSSLIHEDVMVGAADMQITGKTKDGREVVIFENGEWAL